MKKIALVAACLFSLPTFADNLKGYYAGAAFDFIDGNATDASNNNVDFRGIEFHGGYKYNSWLGAEARVGFGMSGETFSMQDGNTLVDVDVDIDHFESIYYRAEAANTTAKLYGLLGYSNVQTTSGDESTSASGPSYGFGVGFVIHESANLNFEYRQLLNSSDNEFTSLSIGFDYRF
jgi:hypothetical protein